MIDGVASNASGRAGGAIAQCYVARQDHHCHAALGDGRPHGDRQNARHLFGLRD